MLILSLRATVGYHVAVLHFRQMNLNFVAEVIGRELICVFNVDGLRVETLREITGIAGRFDALDITSEMSRYRVSHLLDMVS